MQIIWLSSTRVGIASATGASGATYIIARYDEGQLLNEHPYTSEEGNPFQGRKWKAISYVDDDSGRKEQQYSATHSEFHQHSKVPSRAPSKQPSKGTSKRIHRRTSQKRRRSKAKVNKAQLQTVFKRARAASHPSPEPTHHTRRSQYLHHPITSLKSHLYLHLRRSLKTKAPKVQGTCSPHEAVMIIVL